MNAETAAPPTTPWSEPTITINGKLLSVAESMTLRVAITGFHSDMTDPMALGEDDTGRAIARGYRLHSENILRHMNVLDGDPLPAS